MSLECSQEPINTLPPPAKSSSPQEVRHAHRKEVLLHLGNVLGMGRLQNHLLANGRGWEAVMGYIDHRRLIHSEAKKIGENHFSLCSGHHVLIAPLSHANLSRSEHENLDKKPAKSP